MDPAASLLAVLGLLYAFECLHWVRRDAWVLSLGLGRRGRLAQTDGPLGNTLHAAVLAWPLPPLGPLLVIDEPLVVFGEAGALVGGVVVPWDGQLRAEGRKLVAGRTLLKLSSAASARAWAARFRQLAGLSPRARAKWLGSKGAPARELAALEERLARHRRLARPLRALCHLELLALAAVVPLLFWVPVLGPLYLEALLGLAALHLAVVGVHHRLHLRLYPEERAERWVKTASLVLNLPGGVRTAPDSGRDLFADCEPLAVVAALLPRARLRASAAEVLRRLDHPLPRAAEDERVAELVAEGRAHRRREVVALLGEVGIAEAELLTPPEPETDHVKTFCPRCLAQYEQGEGDCAECPGVGLTRFVGR